MIWNSGFEKKQANMKKKNTRIGMSRMRKSHVFLKHVNLRHYIVFGWLIETT